MKKQVAPPTYAVNNIQQLPDIVKNQATMLKVKFDKGDADTRSYIINTLLATLNSNDGSFTIGHDSPNITADNVGDGFEELYQLIQSVSQGAVPDGTISKQKLTVLLASEIEGKANTTDVNQALSGKSNLIGGNNFSGSQFFQDNIEFANNKGVLCLTTTGTSRSLATIGADNKSYLGDSLQETIIRGTFVTLPPSTLTITTITSGFSAGWVGTVKVRKGLGNLVSVIGDISKTTDVVGAENIFTLAAGTRPSQLIVNTLNLFKGATPIIGNDSYLSIETNGVVAVSSNGITTDAKRLLFNFIYYSS